MTALQSRRKILARLGKIGGEFFIFVHNTRAHEEEVLFELRQKGQLVDTFHFWLPSAISHKISLAHLSGRVEIIRNGKHWLTSNVGIFQPSAKLEFIEASWEGNYSQGYFLKVTVRCIHNMLRPHPLKATQTVSSSRVPLLAEEKIQLSDGETYDLLIPFEQFDHRKGIIFGTAIISMSTIFTHFLRIPRFKVSLPDLIIRKLIFRDGILSGQILLDQELDMNDEGKKITLSRDGVTALFTIDRPLSAGEVVEFSFKYERIQEAEQLSIFWGSQFIHSLSIPEELKTHLSIGEISFSDFVFSTGSEPYGSLILQVQWTGFDMTFPICLEVNIGSYPTKFFVVFLNQDQTITFELGRMSPICRKVFIQFDGRLVQSVDIQAMPAVASA